MPQRGDTVVDGIHWIALTVEAIGRSDNNTSMIDGMLVDLKLRSLFQEINFCFPCIFLNRSGEGLMLERLLRTLKQHILVYCKPKNSRRHELTTRLSPKELLDMTSVKLKRVWLDKNDFKLFRKMENLKLQDFLVYQPGKEIREFQNWTNGVSVNLDLKYLHKLDSISEVSLKLKCECLAYNVSYLQAGLLIEETTVQGVTRPTIKIGMLNLNNSARVYTEEFRDYSIFRDSIVPDGVRNNPECSLFLDEFPRCFQSFNFTDIIIPPPTWLLIADFHSNCHKTPVENLRSATYFKMFDEEFSLNWVSIFNIVFKKFTSLHRVGKNWYLFDDANGNLLNYDKASKVNYKSSFNARAYYVCTPKFDSNHCLYERSKAKVDALVRLRELNPLQ